VLYGIERLIVNNTKYSAGLPQLCRSNLPGGESWPGVGLKRTPPNFVRLTVARLRSSAPPRRPPQNTGPPNFLAVMVPHGGCAHSHGGPRKGKPLRLRRHFIVAVWSTNHPVLIVFSRPPAGVRDSVSQTYELAPVFNLEINTVLGTRGPALWAAGKILDTGPEFRTDTHPLLRA